MAYKAPNPISKIKISGEDDCIPSELNEINLASGANVSLSTDYDSNTITISSTAGPTNLSDLSDITIVNPQNGETLVYDDGTGKWINSTVIGSLPDGDAPGQMLVWDRILPMHINFKQGEVNSSRSTLLEKYNELRVYVDEARPDGWLPEGVFKTANGAKFAIRVIESPGDEKFELLNENITFVEGFLKGYRHTVKFNFVGAGSLSVSRDNVGYTNYFIAGVYPDHYVDTKLITITIPPGTMASDIVTEINNAGFPDIEAELLVDAELSSVLDSQLEQGLGFSDLAYYQQSQPHLSDVWHIGDVTLQNYETKADFFGSAPDSYMYTTNTGDLGFQQNAILIQPGVHYFGGAQFSGIGTYPFLEIRTDSGAEAPLVDSNFSVRLIKTEVPADPNVSLFWEATDAPASGEEGISGQLTIVIKLDSADFNDIHDAFYSTYSDWVADPNHASLAPPGGTGGSEWGKFFNPSFDSGVNDATRSVIVGFDTVEDGGNPIYTDLLSSTRTSAYATGESTGLPPEEDSVFIANPGDDISWEIGIFTDQDGTFADWDGKIIEHGDFPFSRSLKNQTFYPQSREDEKDQYSDNFYRTWDQRKSEYTQMVELAGGVPDLASMTVEEASSPLFYGWRKLTPVMNGGYPVWDVNWRIVHSSETSSLDSAEIETIPADDITPGDDFVLITTTSGFTTLSSQDSDVNISAFDKVNISAENDILMDWNDGRTIRFYDNGSQVKIKSDDSDIIIGSTNGKAFFYAKDDLDITSDDGEVIIDGYLGIDIESEKGGMDVNVSQSINMVSSTNDINLTAFDKVMLNTTVGAIDISPNTNFNVIAGGSATISTDDNILLNSDALITLDADSFININAGNRIKLDTMQDIVLDSGTGIWDFKEDGVSQLQITTSPHSNDLSFAATNPYGQVYFGIDTPFPVDGIANTKGLMIALRGYDDDVPPDEVDGYVGMVGINFQSGAPGNLLDIMAERNDQGFQVSTEKSDGSGPRPLLRFAKENNEYGRLLIYKEDSTSAVDIGARPGMKHYFHANGATKFAIGTKFPNTLLHIANDTNPYITMQNLAVEHGDGQCETQLRFADHEENTLAYIEGSHDGAADDHKGKLRFLVNDGTDTWRDGIIIGHAGDVKKIGQSTPSEGDVLTWDNHNQRAIWSDSLDDGYIEDLQDVDFGVAGPSDGDALVYDAATETWVNSPISGGGGGGGLSLTTSATDTLAFGNAMWANLAGNSSGLTNGEQWTTTISIPNGATVIDVIVDIGTAFDNMGSYDTIVTWQPGSDLFAFSGFYDGFGYFSSYYGSKILGNVGTATANGSWTNNSGGAQFLKLNFHHEVSWGVPTVPTTGSMTVFVRYLS